MVSLSYIAPGFIVADVNPAVSFYTDKLGFELRYIAPDDGPFFAILGRDEVSIMLKAVTPDTKPVPNRTIHEWAPWDAYISVDDPDSLFEEYGTRGIEFPRPLKDDDDGLRGFEVKDIDGYILFFGRPIKKPSPKPAFKTMSPQLLVSDIEQSIVFYTEKLSFSLDFRYDDFYAGIVKDDHSIHLKTGSRPAKTSDDIDITFSVDDIKDLYHELKSRSVEIIQPLRQMPYGKEFYIADPDGHRLAFLEA